MKIINKILGIGLLALSLTLVSAHKTMAQDDTYVSDQDFYDDLQPYGTWIYDPYFGNVWVPDVDGDFRPYASRGHWVQTDYGTTWVSDYPWGWATFHYGRWRYDDYFGWEWIPGQEWAPAWVSWRHGGGYYGWAPLTPGITITISFGGGYNVPDNYWVCAPERYINRPNIYNYYVPPSRSVTIIHNTTIINNTYVYNNRTYITGPRPQEIQRYTRQPVHVYRINNASRPGVNVVQNNTVNIYRPAITKLAGASPARVVNAVAYKQANPNQGIGRGGAVAYNHNNAAKLATVARSTNPDNKVVHVNPVSHNRPAPNTPPVPAERPVANKPEPQIDHKRTAPQAGQGNSQVAGQQQANQQQAAQQAQQQRQQKQQAAQQANQQADQQKQQAAEQVQQQRQQQQQAAQQATQQADQQKQQAAQQAQQQRQQQQQAAQQAQQQRQQQQKAAQQAQQQQKAAQQQRQQQARQKQQQPPPKPKDNQNPPL